MYAPLFDCTKQDHAVNVCFCTCLLPYLVYITHGAVPVSESEISTKCVIMNAIVLLGFLEACIMCDYSHQTMMQLAMDYPLDNLWGKWIELWHCFVFWGGFFVCLVFFAHAFYASYTSMPIAFLLLGLLSRLYLSLPFLPGYSVYCRVLKCLEPFWTRIFILFNPCRMRAFCLLPSAGV